jgi:putative heme-binding domain-containing protein
MIYLGDNWPEQYRNTFFTNNIHGKRINNDILRRRGSGYTASHGRDLMRAQDPWFMGVTLRYGPDGSVFSSDWSDTGECHSVKNTRRHTGRIFKISFGQPKAVPLDLASLGDRELVQLQLHRNDWYVQHARRLLQERAVAGRDLSVARRELQAMFGGQKDVSRRLRAMWALKVIGGLDDDFLIGQLENASEYIRLWCIRLLCEDGDPPEEALRRFRELAATGDSPFDRLYLASSLQRLRPAQRWLIAEALLSRGEDAGDANLPLMIWYGVEPLVNEDADRFVKLAGGARIPLVRRHIARRTAFAASSGKGLVSLVQLLGSADSDIQQDLLDGMLLGLEGRRRFEMPAGWAATYAVLRQSPRTEIREDALELALIFDDPVALKTIRDEAADARLDGKVRTRAVHALVAKKVADLAPFLLQLIGDPATRSASLRGLAEYDDPRTPVAILEGFSRFDAQARQDAVQTLSSRPAWATALLDAVESNRIPRTELSAFTARQLMNLGNDELTARVNALWGTVRETAADKARLIADYKKRLTPESLARADRSAGRLVYQQTCANCHKLFDSGGAIGPEITGSQRQNLDYLLENLIDPSGAVVRDYQMQIIETKAGRVITGLIVAENKTAVTIQTVNEKVVVPADEIEDRVTSSVSMMPEGMLQKLSNEQVRDLVAYVIGTTQVPLKEDVGARGE